MSNRTSIIIHKTMEQDNIYTDQNFFSLLQLTEINESFAQYPVPVSGYISNMYVYISQPPIGGTVIMTLRVNNHDTSLSCIILDNQQPSVSKNTNARVLVNAGDLICTSIHATRLQNKMAINASYSFEPL